MASQVDYLYYYLDTLANEVSLETLHSAQMTLDPEGRVMPDDLQLGDSERQTFDMFAKEASAKVFKAISKYAQNIDDAYNFNVDLSTLEDVTAAYGIMFYISMATYWDVNMLSILDVYVERAIKEWIKYLWFSLKKQGDLAGKALNDYNEAITQAKSAGEMRTKAAKKTYHMGIPNNSISST